MCGEAWDADDEKGGSEVDGRAWTDKRVHVCICPRKCKDRCLSVSCVWGSMGAEVDKRNNEVERRGVADNR